MQADIVSHEDREGIERLKARYFRAIDQHRWEELPALFSADARFEGFAFPTANTAEFIAGVSAYLDNVKSAHQGVNSELRQIGPGSVRGIWPMHDVLIWPIGSRESFGDVTIADQWGIDAYGYYEDEYSLTTDGWRISFQRLTRTIVRALTGDVPVISPSESLRLPTPGWL